MPEQSLVNPSVDVKQNWLGTIGNVVSKFSPLAGAGLSMVQSLIDARRQKKNIQIQNAQNMELAKYQFDRNQEMFDKANKYNEPAAQMDRYKQAGLNPNLIYSQGTPGNAPNTLPQYQRPQLEANFKSPFNLPEVLSQYLSMSQGFQQLHNLRTQGAILDAEKQRKTAEAINAPSYYGNRPNIQLKQLGLYDSNINLSNRRADLVDKQIQNFIPLWFIMVTKGMGSVGDLIGNMIKIPGFKKAPTIKMPAPQSLQNYQRSQRYDPLKHMDMVTKSPYFEF